mgnify:CR=1 FL=1|jgi:hypothetical protein
MAFATIDVTKGITGTIPVANGGTGIASGTTGQFLKFTGTTTIASAADNAGKILQVQSATTTSVVAETGGGTSFLDYLSRTITPSSSSSKILLMGTVAEPDQLDGRIKASFFRNSTELTAGGEFSEEFGRGLGFSGTEDHFFNMASMFVDSPSTTSEITYRIKVGSQTGSDIRVGNGGGGNLICMEIAG